MTPTLIDEDHPLVKWLASKKQKIHVAGLYSVWRLRNGWVARKQEPESKWSRPTYWTIADEQADTALRLGGGEHRLTRAIANTLNNDSSAMIEAAAAMDSEGGLT